MSQPIQIPYQDTALPTDSDTFVLWNSENFLPQGAANMLANMGVNRWTASLWLSQDGTVNGYRRETGSSAWRKFYTNALTAGTEALQEDVFIGGYGEVKFEFVNGGVTQTAFDVRQALQCDPGDTA